MEISKEELIKEYKSGDYEAFFKNASEIAGFVITRKFSVNQPDLKEDLIQDCMESLWKRIVDGKVDVCKGDLLSFIWKNSSYCMLDYFTKQKRRTNKVRWFSYEESITDSSWDGIKFNEELGLKFTPDNVIGENWDD